MAITVSEQWKSKKSLAGEIMEHVRDELVVQMPFFNRALLKMPIELEDEFDFGDRTLMGFGTDGVCVYASVGRVLRAFQEENALLSRICLHMVLHCLFSHPFSYDSLKREYWDFAADAAVENTILQMNKKDLQLDADRTCREKLLQIRRVTDTLTADGIYRYLVQHPDEADGMMEQRDLFSRDLHLFWLSDEANTRRLNYSKHPHPGINKISQEWKKLGVSVRLDVQVFEKNMGLAPGSLMENLGPAVQEKYDYTTFLKKFAVVQEEVHINHEEFDYIYYTYGMELYGNIPLIEELEYRETKKIHDFVIAIDTSGSCQGRTVRSFLNKTYTILKSTESFFTKVNIHIIQCDAKIQRDVKVTSDDEFEQYMENVELSGFGGTDFRPVFEYVDGLIRRHEFMNLKGLIYFTDGKGTFPERAPDYETAFLFIEEGFTIPEVPPWAIRLVLREEEV